MALRLAGEEFSVVRGLDSLSYVREIKAGDSLPSLKVTQNGSGPGLQIVHAATGENWLGLYLGANRLGKLAIVAGNHFNLGTEGGDLQFAPYNTGKVDLQKAIYNSTANNNGRVSFADDVELQSGYKLFNLAVEAFTEAAKPSASGNAGRIIYVGDGAAGSKFQGSDGTSWVSLG